MSKSFAIRMFLWWSLVLYMVCDFFFFNGPMKQELRSMFPTKEDQIAEAISKGICAKVYNAPIYLSQVDRRVQERLWRTGRKPEAVRPNEMRVLRIAAMDEIIAENLLRIKAKVNSKEITVTEEEINAELSQFEKKFTSSEKLDIALTAQGIESRKELRFRIAARIQQEKYIETKIKSALTITDEEAQLWYEQHQEELKMPERRKVRHVFLATLDHPSADAQAALTKHLATLKSGKIDFPSLAATISEDERSKKNGGDLGWMRTERLPGDFATHAFSLPVNTPQLVRTKLGWHIIEVTEIKPPELLPFETMKEEILAAIADSRRRDAVKQYRHQLRLLNHKHVEIFPQVITS